MITNRQSGISQPSAPKAPKRATLSYLSSEYRVSLLPF